MTFESLRWWLHGLADRLTDAAFGYGYGRRQRWLLSLAMGCDSLAMMIFVVEHTTPRDWVTRDRAIEALGAFFGLLGAFMLAFKGDWAGWGFVALLASNIGWLAFGWIRGHWLFFAQQVGFTASSLLGIWRWLL